jgi:hypothetical protein
MGKKVKSQATYTVSVYGSGALFWTFCKFFGLFEHKILETVSVSVVRRKGKRRSYLVDPVRKSQLCLKKLKEDG